MTPTLTGIDDGGDIPQILRDFATGAGGVGGVAFVVNRDGIIIAMAIGSHDGTLGLTDDLGQQVMHCIRQIISFEAPKH